MGLDITIKEVEEICCPDCGRLVTTKEVDEVDSSGRVWCDILTKLGYYVPYEQRNETNDWYGKDMTLTPEQTQALFDFVEQEKPYPARDLSAVISQALASGNKIVVNADW